MWSMATDRSSRPVSIDAGPVEWPAIVVHGGAGTYQRVTADPALARRLGEALDVALDAGWEVLAGGGDPVDAVVAAVRVMEDDGGFNAGRGAVPTTSGTVEMDGSVMDGSGRAGAVACITGRSAVASARAVWAAEGGGSPGERVLLLAGPAAGEFAAAAGVPALAPLALSGDGRPGAGTEPAPLPPASPSGTVGAVAVSAGGRFAAATSTGGRAGQPPGRVGDTPIPGAGVWAEEGCAVSATGAGEAFILAGFARCVAGRRTGPGGLADSMRAALAEVARYGGDGGGIALGADRTWAAAYDTVAMARALRHAGGRKRVVLGPDG